jgi:hypothetical protein
MTLAGRLRAMSALAALSLLTQVSLGRAQGSDEDKALALQLFDAGRALLGAGKVDEACRKLEESRHLDPLPGTMLNLAVCHERQGRAASAVAEFREARELAERSHRDDRVAFIDEHLKALEGKVSSLLIVVPAEADRPDLSISRDGTAVGRAAWGTPIPVDPGQHRIEASAPNKVPQTLTITVAPNGDVETSTLAPLADVPLSARPPAIAPQQEAPPPASPTPAMGTAETRGQEVGASRGVSTRRTLALVTGGAALAGAAAGAYFGLAAIAKHNAPGAVCTEEPCTQATKMNGEAATTADASTVSFAVAAVAAVSAAFLWFSDSDGKGGGTPVRVAPTFALGRAGGVEVGGRF